VLPVLVGEEQREKVSNAILLSLVLTPRRRPDTGVTKRDTQNTKIRIKQDAPQHHEEETSKHHGKNCMKC